MKGALIILIVTVATGIILYFHDRIHRKQPSSFPSSDESNADTNEGTLPANDAEESGSGECCGLHLVCEKELTAIAEDRILYYDDEELDRFAGRSAQDYTGEETEEFRDVLMTLLPQDVTGWARSLDKRKITPPQEIRDELLIMLQELV